MVNLSNKTFLAFLLIFAVILIFAVLVAVNFMGWGTALSGFGGPVASTILSGLQAIPLWVLSGGWPTMGAGIAFIAILLVLSGYVFEKKHIIATVTGKNGSANTGNYQSAPSQNVIPIDNLQSQPTQKE